MGPSLIFEIAGPQKDISRSRGPQYRRSGRGHSRYEDVSGRETSTAGGCYFFFAVFLTVRLRAGALFFTLLAAFFFMAISGLLGLWSFAAAQRAPPRIGYYAEKVNKPLPPV